MNRANVHDQLSTSPSDTESNVLISQHFSGLNDHPSLRTSQEAAHRFLVLVPADADYSAITRQLWELAYTAGMHVQILSLCKDAEQASSLHRALFTMASLLKHADVSAEAKVQIGINWVEFVKGNYQAGDMIVCFAEQRVGLLHRPLSQILESNLYAPIYILSGLYPQRHSQSNSLSEVAAWTGSIGIILSFGILQAQVLQWPEGWLPNVSLIFSIISEFWLIRVWNNLFS